MDVMDYFWGDNALYDLDASKSKLKKFKLRLEYRPLTKYFGLGSLSLNSLPTQELDCFLNPSESNLINFSYYSNDSGFESLENSYEGIKNLKYLYYLNNRSTYLANTSLFTPVAYTTVLDYFRADFDEQSWSSNLDSQVDFRKGMSYTRLNSAGSSSLTNSMKLRSTAKNSIVTYNAIQKVYKSRFDDSRSNACFDDFINSYSKYPFLVEPKTPYESILGKNKESYFNVFLYNKEFVDNSSIFSST